MRKDGNRQVPQGGKPGPLGEPHRPDTDGGHASHPVGEPSARPPEEIRPLLEEAEMRFRMSQESYEELAACEQLLRRALDMAPDCQEARALYRQVLITFSRVARSYGDMWLARVKAARLDEGAEREELLHELDEQDAQLRIMRLNASQRTVLVVLCIVLGLAVLAVSVVLMQQSSRFRRHEMGVQKRLGETEEVRASIQRLLSEEKRRANVLRETLEMREAELDMADTLLQVVPGPSRLLYADEPSLGGESDAAVVKRLLTERTDLRSKRKLLLDAGSRLMPEPVSLLMADAHMALETAGATSDTQQAYELYAGAAKAHPRMAAAHAGMAVAAARGGQWTSAALHMADALSAGRTLRGVDTQVVSLALELRDSMAGARAAGSDAVKQLDDARGVLNAAIPSGAEDAVWNRPKQASTTTTLASLEEIAAPVAETQPGTAETSAAQDLSASVPQQQIDLVIESRQEGMNHDFYAEIEGAWVDSNSPALQIKSAASGLTPAEQCGTRKVMLPDTVTTAPAPPASVRFTPGLTAPARLNVYATWGRMANAAPVTCIIHHAGGDTKKTLAQNGRGVDANANQWIHLGNYSFAAGASQYVEFRIGSDAAPKNPAYRGQFYADAVRFTTEPLSDEETRFVRRDRHAPPSSASSPFWYDDELAAMKLAAANRKNLLIYFCTPFSPATRHFETNVLSDQRVRTLLREMFVLARIDYAARAGSAKKLGVERSGTIAIYDHKGKPVAVLDERTDRKEFLDRLLDLRDGVTTAATRAPAPAGQTTTPR